MYILKLSNTDKNLKLLKNFQNYLRLSISSTIHYSLFTIHYKTAGFGCVRDVEGAEGGANWNERREDCEA
jgi:hypothetical protein